MFEIGDVVEVFGYNACPQWTGEEFEIKRISGYIAYDYVIGEKMNRRSNGFQGAMYLQNLRHASRPEDFIDDII